MVSAKKIRSMNITREKLEGMTIVQLHRVCKELKLHGFHSCKRKSHLVNFILRSVGIKLDEAARFTQLQIDFSSPDFLE